MFFKDFVLLIGIGLLIGAPLVYLGITEWLNGYAFRINFPWWAMAISTLLLITISLITVSLHSFKAASINPVESIKE